MDKPVELIPLVCTRCSTSIPADPQEVAWVCQQCGQGMYLDMDIGLVPLEVNYSAAIPPGERGKPFWLAQGEVSMARLTYGSSSIDDQASERFWNQSHFFVPAYQASLEDLLKKASDLLIKPPDLQPGPPAPFEPVTLARQDVKPAAEFIMVALEAGRKDQVKRLDFELKLSEPILWILP